MKKEIIIDKVDKKSPIKPDLFTITQATSLIIEKNTGISLTAMLSPLRQFYLGRVLFAGILSSYGIESDIIKSILHKKKDSIEGYIAEYNNQMKREAKKYIEVTNAVSKILTINNKENESK